MNIFELENEEIDLVDGAASDTPAYNDGKSAGRVIGQGIEDALEYVGGFISGLYHELTN